MRIRRVYSYQLTTLELNGPDMDIEIRIVSRFPKAQRRWIALSFLRQIRPWLKYFHSKTLEHKACGRPHTPRALERGIFVPEGAEFQELQEKDAKFGYEIRTRRLELELSQAEVAHMTGISRSHLSDIERGIHHPQRLTRERLEKILRADVGKESDKSRFHPLELKNEH